MFVILLLWLNLTVAIGTLNSIIFYANIINANQNIYFSQPYLTFVPVFISWLNLNIGFDVCFFEGMNVYDKTWIQLAFPMYIIFLVLVIIFICSSSSKFTNLLGKRNPVATLATLILLSYTKLLETVIATFSFIPLKIISKWYLSHHSRSKYWIYWCESYHSCVCCYFHSLCGAIVYHSHFFLAMAPTLPKEKGIPVDKKSEASLNHWHLPYTSQCKVSLLDWFTVASPNHCVSHFCFQCVNWPTHNTACYNYRC